MSIINSGFSAIGRLAALAVLLGVFLFGLAGVVYMSLQGAEITVPEITGKNFEETEKELALLGLKIKKRADRVSAEKPNTVIEQLPKAGETVKTGQTIRVVVSKGGGEADVPPSLKTTEEDDAEKIEEMISDKPKKTKSNSNTRKKADTARDVNSESSNTSTSNSKSNPSESNSNKKDPASNNNSSDKPNKNTQTPTSPKPANSAVKPDSRPKPPIRP